MEERCLGFICNGDAQGDEARSYLFRCVDYSNHGGADLCQRSASGFATTDKELAIIDLGGD